MAHDTLSAYLRSAYPKTVTLRDGMLVAIRSLLADDREDICKFFDRVPEDDRAFLKEDVINRREVEAWLDRLDPETETVMVAEAPDRIVGTAVLGRQAHGWARHVGEIRVVADPSTRRQGLGHVLAETIFALAVRLGLEKIIAQMMTDQTGAVRVFELLGFHAEATLRNHVKDRYSHKHDLLIMANDLETTTVADPDAAFIPHPR
ncbi:MAG: GNAT family N-acetyltransferase [Candidatus Binataceae bacterium]